jgi:integrase/recombinase XerD
VLRVRRGKLGRERLLPLDPTVVAQLVAYAAERDRLLGRAAPAFFVTEKGTRLTDCGARYNFARARQQTGLRADQQYCRHGRGPRIHDLRHTFLSLNPRPATPANIARPSPAGPSGDRDLAYGVVPGECTK